MADITRKILLKLGISQNQGIILCVVAGVIAIVVFVLVMKILRGRKFKRVIKITLADDKESGDKQPQDNYESIIERIKQTKKKYKSVLFASVDTEALPVTIPVNVAIGLAKRKKRCLLIDLDLKRDAVAKAFGLNSQQGDLRAKSVQTEVENLWVWPGHYFSQSKHMNVMGIVEKAEDGFDFILINAPSLMSSPDRRQIILAARAAFICNKDTSEADKLTELIKPLDCTIIGHVQSL